MNKYEFVLQYRNYSMQIWQRKVYWSIFSPPFLLHFCDVRSKCCQYSVTRGDPVICMKCSGCISAFSMLQAAWLHVGQENCLNSLKMWSIQACVIVMTFHFWLFQGQHVDLGCIILFWSSRPTHDTARLPTWINSPHAQAFQTEKLRFHVISGVW